jgi:hypothetical protein
VLSSLLGRLITGPLAFLLAGVYDVAAFFGALAYRSVLARLRALAARVPPAVNAHRARDASG